MSCVHTRVPAESNGHVATKCRDNCRAFPSSRRLAAVGGWFLFRRHSTKRDSYPALGNHLPSSARVPSIASTRNTPSRFNVSLDVSSKESRAFREVSAAVLAATRTRSESRDPDVCARLFVSPRSPLSALYSVRTRCLDAMRDLSKLCDLIRDGRITTSASRRGKSRWIVRVTGRWTRGSSNLGEEEEETTTGHGGSKREEKTDEEGREEEERRTRQRREKKRSGTRRGRSCTARRKESGSSCARLARSYLRLASLCPCRTYAFTHTRSRIRVRGRHHRDPDVSHGT